MKLNKLIKKRKKTIKKEKPPGKEQPLIEKGAPDLRDHMAPSLVKELAPSDLTLDTKAGDYMVEIGAGTEFNRYFRSFTAQLKTSTTYAGMYDQYYQGEFGNGNLDIALHIRPSDENRTLHNISRLIKGLESDYVMTNDSIKKARIRDSIIDLQEQEKRIRRNIERLFFVSTQVVVSANNIDDLKKFSNSLLERAAGDGVIFKPNDRKQLPALICMTPFDLEQVFEESFRNMESSCIADLFPFGQGGISHTTGIILGRDIRKNVVYFDPWHPELPNAHMVIFGRSGMGKSYAIKLITMRSSFIGIKTGIIDPDKKREYEAVVKELDGSYIALDPDSEYRINMFDVDKAEDEKGNVTVELEQSINAVQAIIFKMINVIDPKLLEDGVIKILLREKIRKLYSDRGITSDPESLYTNAKNKDGTFELGKRQKKKMPTLSDFHTLLEEDEDERLRDVATVLKLFTRKSNDPVMSIFDCQSNVNISKDTVFAFAVGNLEENIMKPIGMFIATKWMMDHFAYQNRFQKKRIIVDEAQEAMKSPEMADWLEEAFRQMRRYNTSMCAASQGFEVFMRVPQGLGILKNATIKLIFRQEAVDIDAVQKKFKLNEGEASFVLDTPSGTGLLMVDNESTIVRIEATDMEDKLYTTDPNQLKELEMKRRSDG